MDRLVLTVAERFTELHGHEAGDIATHAAGDARHLGELLLRAYAQTTTAEDRRAVLDHIDALLRTDAYGFPELVQAVER